MFVLAGASDVEKEYMLTSKPKLLFSVDGDVIKTTNCPHPDTQPDVVAECDFKLNQEFQFEPRGLMLKVHFCDTETLLKCLKVVDVLGW